MDADIVVSDMYTTLWVGAIVAMKLATISGCGWRDIISRLWSLFLARKDPNKFSHKGNIFFHFYIL